MVSLLKEYWGETAQPDNDFCFDHLPRIDGDHGVFRTLMDMVDGKVPGFFLLGQNPAVGMANGRLARLAMAQLDWLVVRDLAMIETRHVLEGRPGGRDRRDRPGDLPDRGLLLPGRVARGEGGHVHPDRADAAVAGEGRRPGRGPDLRAVVRLPPRPAAPGAPGRRRPTSGTGRCSTCRWDHAMDTATRTRSGASRAPRTCCAGSTATTWPPASRSATTGSCAPTAARRPAAGSTRVSSGRGEPVGPPR